MDFRAWATLFIFIASLTLIAKGTLKAATASLLGASLMVFTGLISGEDAFASIDSNTIGLLVGMMIVVGILSKSGLFQFMAVKAIKLTKGNAVLIFWIISLLTATLSAFLDNVTTVLLVTPVVLSLCDLISMNPMPLLFAELFASNIGGTATLIGDPPNMIIGSAAGLSFNDFLMTATPVAIIVWAAVTELVALYYKRDIKSNPAASGRLNDVDESKLIVDRPLMIKSVIVIFFVLLGFILCRMIHVEASTVALTAAAVLLAVSFVDEGAIIHNDIEWPTLIYFISLFIMGGALRINGVIERMANLLTTALAGNPLLMLLGILWISGITCMFVNNIAYTTIFVSIVKAMASAAHMQATPLFWALAFGACLGGNGTYFGAAANAVVADFAAKEGMPVSFGSFFKLGIRTVLLSLVIASAALVVIGWPVISK